jgi:hypothetical protein
MRAHVLLAAVATMVWCASASAADKSERTYADPACSARDAKPERCVIHDGPPRRVVAGTRNSTAGEVGAANANAASAGSTAGTATGQTGQSTVFGGRK